MDAPDDDDDEQPAPCDTRNPDDPLGIPVTVREGLPDASTPLATAVRATIPTVPDAQKRAEDELLWDIRRKVEERMHKTACKWQLRSSLASVQHHDVIVISATGSGKSLPMYIPLILIPGLFIIVIVPLKVIGEQVVATVQGLGFRAVNITALNATSAASVSS